jgi:hypothetical protein
MATTRSSPVRTTLHIGRSLLSTIVAKAKDLLRERAGRPRPGHEVKPMSAERQGMMEANKAPLVTNDADADAFEAMKRRRSRRVAKPLTLK